MPERLTVGELARVLGESSCHVLLARALKVLGQERCTELLTEALLIEHQGGRWKNWLEQQHLAAQESPMHAVLETIAQLVAQDTEADPEGGPGARRIKPPVAPDRRISLDDAAMRHGRTRSAKTCTGFKEPMALDVDSHVTREVVVCPAHQPEHEAVALLAEVLEHGPGLCQLAIDLGERASPRMAQWAAQGVHIMARPWPQRRPLLTKDAGTLDFPHGTVTGPNGQTVPMVLGKNAQCPASACDVCPRRAPCTTAQLGHGRRLTIREDEPCQQKLRAKSKTKRGRASLRTRTAVAHAMAHHVAHRGRRAREKGRRKNPFDGRRHAAVSNLLIAAR